MMVYRRVRFFTLCISILTALYTPGFAQEVPADKIMQIEKSLIDSRQRIKSGELRIAIKRTEDEVPELKGIEKRYVNRFDNETLRWDTYYQNSHQTYIFGPSGSIDGDHSKVEPFVVFGPNTKSDKPLGVPDALRLGLVCWYFPSLPEFGFDQHFLRGDRTELTGRIESVDGVEVLKVSYNYTELGGVDASAEYELLVHSDYMPKLIRLNWRVGETSTVAEVESQWKKYEKDVWFPTQTIYRSSDNGVLKNEEITTVESAEFNMPVDPELFELRGLGLKPGRAIDFDGKISYWTGDDLTRTPILADDAPRPLRRYFFLITAVILSALVAFLAFRNFFLDRR